MKHVLRRQKYQILFGGLVAVAGVVSVMFFLILYLPARSDYLELQSSIERLIAESEQRHRTLERLQDSDEKLDAARQEQLGFVATRFISRAQGFAAIMPDLEELAQIAGIDRNRVQYAIDQEPRFGVYSVQVNIPVRGDYSAVTSFIRELERSNTFFILDSIGLSASGSGVPGELSLSLNLTTFFAYDG
jgi:hypothetical protein